MGCVDISLLIGTLAFMFCLRFYRRQRACCRAQGYRYILYLGRGKKMHAETMDILARFCRRTMLPANKYQKEKK